MTRAGDKILAGARDALAVARGDPAVIQHIKVTPSCGCVFCDIGLKPVKMKRQWVHHIPSEGRVIVCNVATLKPRS